MVGLAGVTEIDTGVAAVTLRAAEPDTPLKFALIVTDPKLRVVTRPSYPEALLTAAIVGSDDAQVTDVVRFCVELSVYVPTAVRLDETPLEMFWFEGSIPIDTSCAAVTVTVVDPDTPARDALTVVDPGLSAVARPPRPEPPLTAATAGLEELH
jgi:hypothetical protein